MISVHADAPCVKRDISARGLASGLPSKHYPTQAQGATPEQLPYTQKSTLTNLDAIALVVLDCPQEFMDLCHMFA
jgi:hypothetical protein